MSDPTEHFRLAIAAAGLEPPGDEDKQFFTLRAQYAMTGHTLSRTDAKDGPVSLYAGRWGMLRFLPTLDAARSFLTQITGCKP